MESKVIKLCSFEAFKQRFSTKFSDAILAELYASYCATIRGSGVEISDEFILPVVKAPATSWVLQEAASEKGFCYLLMYKEKFFRKYKKMLGAYPTFEAIMGTKGAHFDPIALGQLRVTAVGEGMFHVGVEGTWALNDVVTFALEGKKHLGGYPFSVFTNTPVDSGLTPCSRFGFSEILDETLVSAVSMLQYETEFGLKIGQRLRVFKSDGGYYGTGTIIDERTLQLTSSMEGDENSAECVLKNVSGTRVIELALATCTVCHQKGLVHTHLALCHAATPIALSVDVDTAAHVLGMDIARETKGAATSDAYQIAYDFLPQFLLWWASNGYPTYVPSTFKCTDVDMRRIAQCNYVQGFRYAYLACLRYLFSSKSANVALLATLAPYRYATIASSTKYQRRDISVSRLSLVNAGMVYSYVYYVRYTFPVLFVSRYGELDTVLPGSSFEVAYSDVSFRDLLLMAYASLKAG